MTQQHLDFGTSAPNDGGKLRNEFQKIEDNFTDLYAQPVETTKPFVILATGQSNFNAFPVYSWAPAGNLLVWNYNHDPDTVGNAFAAHDSATITAAGRFASDFARANPARQVYLICIALGGMGIDQWLPNPPNPPSPRDLYALVKNNVTPALAALGLSQIDLFMWRQGEQDAPSPNTYLTKFETLMTRFQAETWFPITTPVIVWGIVTDAIANISASPTVAYYDRMNTILEQCVCNGSDTRMFVDVASIGLGPGNSYWYTTTNPGPPEPTVHMTGLGYDLSSHMAAMSFMYGTGRNLLQNIRVDRVTGYVHIGTGISLATAPLMVSQNAAGGPTPAGINATATTALVHFVAADNYPARLALDDFGTGNAPEVIGRHARGSNGGPTAVQAGDVLMRMSGLGYGTTLYPTENSNIGIEFRAAQNFTNTVHGTVMVFMTTAIGSTTLTSRAQLDENALTLLSIPLSAPRSDSTNFGATAPEFRGVHANGTSPSPTATQSDDVITRLNGIGYGATGYSSVASNAGIEFRASENWTDTRYGTYMVFRTTSIGATALTSRLILDETSLRPAVDGALPLGAAANRWSNLFLATGGKIDWNNGDVTITHAADLLAFAGAASGYTFDNLLIVGHTASLSIGSNADNHQQYGTTAATGGMALGMFNATAGTAAHFDFYRSKNAAIGSATVVASGDVLGNINWYGAQQTGTFATQTMAAQIRVEVDGTVTSGGSGDMPGRMVFATTADGGAAVTDRMTIDAGGRLFKGVSATVPVLGDSAGTGSGIQQHGTGYADSSILAARYLANIGGSFLFLGHSRNATPGAHTILVTGDTLGTVDFLGSDGVTFQESVSIVGQCEGTIGVGAMPGRLLIQTAPASSVTPTTRTTWDSKGNLIHGTAALLTTATDGFLYIPTCAGAPTGDSTDYTGRLPMIYDTTNNKLWFNTSGTTWKGVVLA